MILSNSNKRFFALALTLGLLGLPSVGEANLFFKRGFQLELKGDDAGRGYRNAIQVGNLVIAQVGNHYLTAVNDQSGSERWRFDSPTGSIRKVHDRVGWLLVEAENLMALESATGKERWSFPLNCYSATKCNTRVREITADVVLLSGFDGQDDQLMLVDAKTGQRLWPNWVELSGVAAAKRVAYTTDTIVVAGGRAPFAVVGLDRYTGRERWRFRPEGTDQAAAGLVADNSVVTTWWTSRTADEVYSLDLATGKPLSDWMVGRRASSIDEARAGGPGFFYAYQPSVLGGGGTARAWDTKTGDPLWRKRIEVEFAPDIRKGRVYLWDSKRSRASFVAYNALSGKESWRYDRRGVDGHDQTYQDPLILIRIIGDVPFVNVLVARTGQIIGIARLEDEALHTAFLRFSNGNLFALTDKKLVRFKPHKSSDLVFQFNQLIEDARFEEAGALHNLLRPFVDELEGAKEIHRRVTSRQYREEANSMQKGSFSALLPVLERRSRESELLYYEDFRNFVINVKSLLEPHDLTRKLKGRDLQRLATVCTRLIAVMVRFERKLDDADKELLGSLLSIIVDLGRVLLQSGDSETAHAVVYEVYSRAWVDRSAALVALAKRSVIAVVSPYIAPLERAVTAGGKGATEVVTKIAAIKGLDMLISTAPAPSRIPELTLEEYETLLRDLKTATKAP